MAQKDAGSPPNKLKFRLTSAVVLLVLTATVLVTLVALLRAERDMKAIIGDQQYALLSSAAAFIDDRIESRKQMVATLADSLPPEVRAEPARLQPWLGEHVKLGGYFLNVAAFDPTGKLIASLVPPRTNDALNVGARPYFQRTLVAQAPVVSQPIRSALSGAAVVIISVAVRDAAGAVRLVLVGSIDLARSSFLPEIAALKPGKTGFVFIMTAAGVLVDHPDKSRILEHVAVRPAADSAAARALAGFEGWTEANNRDGVQGIYSFKRLKATDWIVGARYPTDEAFAPMIAMRRHAVMGAAALAALAGLLAWLGINRLFAPLDALRRQVAAIGAGKAGIEVLRTRTDDEIGELGAAFHQLMAEREAARARISAEARRARIIADTMPALIAYVNASERYEFTNAHYRELLGVDPAAMIGQTVCEVLGAASYAVLAPHIAAALRGQREHFEYASPRPSGVVHFMIDYLPDIGADGAVAGFYLLALDISARKRGELAQAASEQRLTLITDNLPVLIFYIDLGHTVRFANATLEQWFGTRPADVLDRALADLMHAADYAATLPHLERAGAGEAVTFVLRVAQADGGARILETTFVPDLQADGSVAGVYALAQDVTRMKDVEERLMQLARSDSLTGIANRRMFGELLPRALERARRHGARIAIAYLDIDHFKHINDSCGHAVGDEVLCEFARRLLANVRATDTVARLSGDEFVVLLEDVNGEPEAAAIAAKLTEAVRLPFATSKGPLRVSTSVGVAIQDSVEQGEDALLANADHALYQAKREGRDRVAMYRAA